VHGVIFAELKKYVVANLGSPAWNSLLDAANLTNKLYLPTAHYPDAEAAALVGAASRITGKDSEVLLEDFGAFIAPDLMAMYKSLIKPDWKTLDVIEHTEGVIHTAVRLRNPGAAPPQLQIKRTGPNQLEIIYSSPRRMCAVGRGIIRGLAASFRDNVQVTEPACMTRGDKACRMLVQARG